MHPNPIFRKSPDEKNIDFARWRSFGTLAINASDGPLLSNIPFQLSQDGKFLEAHLVKSNLILKVLEAPIPAVISMIGPDAYISPDWYGVDDQVPTWNYVSVHLRGTLQLLPDAELRGVLERLSENMETRLAGKTPWKIEKMTPAAYEKMARQIVPVAMDVQEIDGTWKLSQNKSADVIKGAVNGLESSGIGSEIEHLREIMRAENDI